MEEGNIDATIVKSKFLHLENGAEPFSSYPLQGFGIHFEGGDLSFLTKVASNNIFAPINFHECRTGIWTKNVGVDIKNNRMKDVTTGIHVEQTVMANVEVTNNIINTRSIGIMLNANDDALEFLVQSNRISVGEIGFPVKGIGIGINEAAMRAQGTANIFDNTIYLLGSGGNDGSASRGIVINTTNKLIVSKNTIHCLATGNGGGNIGIDYKNGIYNGINENRIYGALSATNEAARKTGLKITDCTNTGYNCNYFERLYTGVIFTSNNNAIGTYTDTELRTSVFQPPFFNALHYEKNIMINAQQWNGNKWRGTAAEYGNAFGGVAALNEIETGSPNDVADQKYLIQQMDEDYWPPSIDLPNYTGVGQPWIVFDNDVIGTVASCNQPWYNPIADIKETDKLVATGNIPGTNTAVLGWETQKNLWSKLKSGNYDLSAYPEIEGFWLNTANTPIADYIFLESEQKAIYTAEEQAKNQIAALRLEQEGIRSQLIIKDNEYVLNPSEALLLERDNLLLSLQEKGDVIKTLFDQIMTTRILAADAALNLNQNLITTTTAQENEQVFNTTYLNTLSKSNTDFTAAQIADIYAIAEQCPAVGGRVVYKARSLYTLMDSEFEFEENCSTTQALKTSEGTTNSAIGNKEKELSIDKQLKRVNIYPNPAHTELIVNYGELKEGYLMVFSAVGRVVYESSIEINAKQLSLNTSNWPEGVYFVKIHAGKQELSSNKVIIIH